MTTGPGNRSIFTDPDAYADFDAWHAKAAALRESAGPIKIEDPGFAPFWAVIHHADVKDVAQRGTVFKNAPYPILVPGPDREGGANEFFSVFPEDDESVRTLAIDWEGAETVVVMRHDGRRMGIISCGGGRYEAFRGDHIGSFDGMRAACEAIEETFNQEAAERHAEICGSGNHSAGCPMTPFYHFAPEGFGGTVIRQSSYITRR